MTSTGSLAVATLTLACLGGCATYHAKPLALHAERAENVSALVRVSPIPQRLDIDDVVALAIANNPDLVAARLQAGVAQAQLRSAGLLPNPVFSASYADVQSGPGTFAALAAGLSQDLRALVTLHATRAAAADAAQAVNASVLWQEWQVAGKARLQTIDVVEGDRQLAVLRKNADLAQQRLRRSKESVQQGDATLVDLAPSVVAAADAQKLADDFERQQQTRHRDLAVLIGLTPESPVELTDRIDGAAVDPVWVRQRMVSLAEYRPDLLALRLGYASQEEKLRGAILAQFPLFSLGIAAARDTSNVRTLGPQITMELPLFDRNQGKIAQESATREQLHAEFTARLNAATSEIEALLADHDIVGRQLAAKRRQLDDVQPIASNAEAAYERGDLDVRTYADLVAARNTKEQETIAMETLLLEQQVAIDTLIGAGLRPMVIDGEALAP
jgi:outer membrane protein TolC